MKTILTAIALILIAVSDLSSSDYPDLIARVAPDIIKLAHRYHGIDASIMDEEGRLYFWRDGKRCKLFTNNFLRETSRE